MKINTVAGVTQKKSDSKKEIEIEPDFVKTGPQSEK
jgi:hypothetical protein